MSAEGKAVGKAAEGVIAKTLVEANVRESAQLAAREAGEQAAKQAAERAGKAASRNFDRALLRELEEQGIKHSPERILRIARGADGKIIFLEEGNARAGLQHIVGEHADDFARKGIPEQDLPDLVMDAVRQNDIIGQQGTREPARMIYRTEYNGREVKIAISVSPNGFIMGANPR